MLTIPTLSTVVLSSQCLENLVGILFLWTPYLSNLGLNLPSLDKLPVPFFFFFSRLKPWFPTSTFKVSLSLFLKLPAFSGLCVQSAQCSSQTRYPTNIYWRKQDKGVFQKRHFGVLSLSRGVSSRQPAGGHISYFSLISQPLPQVALKSLQHDCGMEGQDRLCVI